MLQSQANYNTAIGTRALLRAYGAEGVGNVAVGEGVLQRSACDDNTGIGAGSLLANTTGEFNIALGYRADSFPVTGSNNIEIGNAGAGPNEILVNTPTLDMNLIKIGTSGTQRGRIDGVRYDEPVPILLRKLQLQDAKIRDWQAQVAKLGDLQIQVADARAAIVNARLATNR